VDGGAAEGGWRGEVAAPVAGHRLEGGAEHRRAERRGELAPQGGGVGPMGGEAGVVAANDCVVEADE
jgi:hypothetical protein